MSLLTVIIAYYKQRFSLDEDRTHEDEVTSSIIKSTEFKGVNAWVLIFAVFIASIGLNVNSTAVVIGAMLISPLMGPIMGLGLAVGTFNFDLLKVAAKNLLFMVIVSLLTSFLYFFISPISMPSNELIARTTPTIWDVAIAFFGGMAGIIVGSTKDKGLAIPGVAIATALMPPLCTAGYGLATQNMDYFMGAFYLFFINAVMIGFATAITVRFLNFKHHSIPDQKQRAFVKRFTYLVVLLTIIPSSWLGYRIVNQNLTESRLKNYIEQEMSFPSTQTILRKYEASPHPTARILLIGEFIDSAIIKRIIDQKDQYRLSHVKIEIKQANNFQGMGALKDSILLRDNSNEKLLNFKEAQIKQLKHTFDSIIAKRIPTELPMQLLQELQILDDKIIAVSIGEQPRATKKKTELVWIIQIETIKVIDIKSQQIIEQFLSKRLNNKQLRVYWLN